MQEGIATTQRFQRLIDLSVGDPYCPISDLDWDDVPAKDVPWMPNELCSLYDTPHWQQLSDGQKLALSHLELINLFSMTLRGEKEIQADLLGFLYSPAFAQESDYLSLLLGEETDHILMFGKFCRMHFGRVFNYKHIRLKQFEDKDLQALNAFLQTLIAEELLTYYNVEIAGNPDAPGLIRKINERHYKDEYRHIAMGRDVVRALWNQLRNERRPEELEVYKVYIRKYIRFVAGDLANVEIYKLVGLRSPLKIKWEVEETKLSNLESFKPAQKLTKYLMSIDII